MDRKSPGKPAVKQAPAAEDLTLWRGGGALQHFERARPVRRQKQSVEFLELRRGQRVG